jgi:hypothetical protein
MNPVPKSTDNVCHDRPDAEPKKTLPPENIKNTVEFREKIRRNEEWEGGKREKQRTESLLRSWATLASANTLVAAFEKTCTGLATEARCTAG